MASSNIISPNDVELFFEDGVVHIRWKPEAVPDDYAVQVVVTDGQGAALAPLPTISYTGNSATLSGNAIAAGAAIAISLQLVAPPSQPTSVTLISLAKPVAPTVEFTIDGLNVDWLPVDNALKYDVDVQNKLDPSEDPFTFNVTDNSNHVLVPFDELSQRATYQVRVRAVANHSRSVWSDYASILIDKSLPINPVLRALYNRLQAAGTTFDLDADMIQAGNITTRFATLLNQSNQVLAITNAQLSSTLSSVTLIGHLSIFNKSNVQGTFVFTVPNVMLQLDLNIALGSMSVAQLKSADLAPADIYSIGAATSWVDTLAVIDNTVLEFNSAMGTTVVTSSDEGPTWSVLGLANVDLGSLKPQLLSTRVTRTSRKYFVPRLITKLTLGSTHEMDAYLQLPTDYLPWQLGLSKPFYVGSLSDIVALFGGNKLAVPTQFESLGQLTLDQLTLQHAPNSGIWKWYIAATLTPVPGVNGSTAPIWKIIPSVLELEQLGLGLKVNVYQSNNAYYTETAGIISGRFKLGSLDPIDAKLEVPDDSGTWTLTAATSADKPFAFSDTAQLVNNNSTALGNSLAKLGTTSGFRLEALRLSVDPDTPQITAFSIAFQIQDWSIDALPWFTMDEIRARVDVVNPRDDSKRVITGELTSLMTIGSAQVGVMTSYDQQGIWRVALAVQAAQLSGLNDISNFASQGNIASALPSGMPTNAEFEMVGFSMAYNSQKQYITEARFGLRSQLKWQIISHFALNAILIDLQVTQASATAAKVITGEIAGALTVGSARFTARGKRQDAASPWVLSGSLDNQVTFDFNDLLQLVLSSDWKLPKGYGFPTSLSIIAANATLVPSTGKFDFVGDALTDWSFGFGSAKFAVEALGGEIHRAGDDETTSSSGKLYGIFAIGEDIWGEASISLGTGDIDTVITVTAGSGTKLSPSAIAASISGDSTIVSGTPQPSDYHPPTQFQAGIEVNLTQNRFLAWGELIIGANESSPMYGLVALLVQKLPAPSNPPPAAPAGPTWGYVLVAALKNWSFARISQSLAVVDSIISVDAAGLILANYAIETTAQQQMMGKLQLGNGVIIPNNNNLKAGLSLYAQLTFQTPLLGNVASLLNIHQSILTLYAHFGGSPSDTIFTAQLGDFTVFNTIDFSSLELTYQPHVDSTTQQPANPNNPPQTISVIRLLGDASIDFATSTDPNAAFAFTGALTISDESAQFKVSTPLNQQITAPLGMFGITLSQLFLEIDHSFAKTIPPPTIIQLGGKVAFGRQATLEDPTPPQVVLDGYIIWVDGSPVLVDIELAKPLGLIAFFTSVFTGTQYPSNYADVTLKEGRIYYYKSAAGKSLTYNGVVYQPAFNIHTVINLFDVDVTLNVQVVKNQVLPGYSTPQTGLIATGSFGSPITLWFMTLSDKTFTTSPALQLEILDSKKTFGIDVGFSFFQEHFATGFIGVSKAANASDAQLMGRFVYAGNIAILKNVRIGFTYSKSGGFNLTNFPFQANIPLDLSQLASLVNALDGPCAQIVNLGFNQLIKTNFFIKPTMKHSDSNTLQVQLDGIYALSFIDDSYPFLFVDLPQITFTITLQQNLTLAGLPGYIIQQIVNNTGSILTQIVNQPAKLSTFVSVVGARAIIKGLLSHLLCDMEIVEEAQATAEATQAAEAAESAAEALQAAEEAGASAAEIAELAAAAEAAAAGAMGAAAAGGVGASGTTAVVTGVGVVVGAGIGGVIGGFFSLLFGGGGDNPDGLSTGQDSAHPSQPRPQLNTATNIRISAPTADNLTVTWDKVTNATYYQVTLKGNGVNTTHSTGSTQVSFSVGNLAVGQYHAEIVAFTSIYKPSAPAKSSDFLKVATPTLQPLTLNNNVITAVIAQSINGATGYQAQLVKNNTPVDNIETMTGAAPQVQFMITDETATYHVQVMSLASNGIPSVWATSANSIAPLPTTAPGQLTYSDNSLMVTIPANVSGAIQYQAQLVVDNVASGTPETLQPDPNNPAEVRVLYTIADNLNGTNFRVQTRALGANALPSAWTWSSNTIAKLVPPTLQPLHIADNTITATLVGSVALAENYAAQLVVDGVPASNIGPMTNSTPEGTVQAITSAQFTITDAIVGANFQVQVRAAATDHLTSQWHVSSDSINRLGLPSLQALRVANDVLTVTLSAPVTNADSYDAQLVVDGAAIGNIVPMTTSTDGASHAVTSAQFTITDEIAGSIFQVRVKASGANVVSSLWFISTDSITRLAQPGLAALAVVKIAIAARLSISSPNAEGYWVQLVMDRIPIGQETTMTISTDANGNQDVRKNYRIDESLQGSQFQIRVKAFATDFISSIWVISSDAVSRLVTPDVQPLMKSGQTLTVTLQNPVPNAVKYQAEVVVNRRATGLSVPLVISTGTLPVVSGQITIDNPVVAVPYQIQVQALAPNYIPSNWGISAGIALLGEPATITGSLVWNSTPVPHIPVYLLDVDDNQVLVGVITDNSGHFILDSLYAGTYKLNVVAPTDTYWQFTPITDVQTESGKTTEMGTLQLERVVELVSPTNDAIVTSSKPDFSWNALPGITQYRINLIGGNTNITNDVTGTAWQLTAELVSGIVYTWSVEGYNASGKRIARSLQQIFTFQVA